MIDIHSHILPGLDDGSQDMDKSIAMAELAVDCGITDVIATPHCNQRRVFENYASPELEKCFDDFKNELKAAGIELNVYRGSEVFATEDIVQLYRDKRLLTLNDSRYLLVEFDFYSDLAFMEDTLYDLLDEGLVPVLAHPERYIAVQSEPQAAMIWHDEGVGIQINHGSLQYRFGRDAFYTAEELLHSGHVSCVASDAHGASRRTPDMTPAEEWLCRYFDESTADLLLRRNPKRIIKNETLLTMADADKY